MEVTLIINSGDLQRQVTLGAVPLTLGRGEDCGFPLPGDRGLSRLHATIRRRDDRVLLTDGGSTNGSFVNGRRVMERGTELADGDEIRIGHSTVVAVRIKRPRAAVQDSQAAPRTAVPLGVRLAVLSVVMIALSGVGFLLYSLTRRAGDSLVANTHPASTPIVNNLVDKTPTPTPTPTPATPTPTPEVVTTPTPEIASLPAQPPAPPTAGAKDEGGRRPRLYRSMNKEQKAEFIRQRAQHVSIMMSGRPYAMPPEALDLIQYWLDAFASRVGNRRRGLWGGDTTYIFERGKAHAPVIMRAFRDQNVPVVIGLYIPFIETEYTNISSNNHAGAAGLFQFLGDTAEGYGVPRAERTNVPRMAVAAARYFRDNIVTFGDGPMGVALSIAGYNRAPESVKRDLRNILNMESNARERSFWTLVANQGKLDKWFQQENRNYVPRFFAAAIIGETPWAFGIEMRALSTYTEPGGNGTASPPPPSVSAP